MTNIRTVLLNLSALRHCTTSKIARYITVLSVNVKNVILYLQMMWSPDWTAKHTAIDVDNLQTQHLQGKHKNKTLGLSLMYSSTCKEVVSDDHKL